MMTSSKGNISRLRAFCAGNSPVTGEFLYQMPVPRGFEVFLDLNQQLSKQRRRWWFETPSRSLKRHCNYPRGMYSNGIFIAVLQLKRWKVSHGLRQILSHSIMNTLTNGLLDLVNEITFSTKTTCGVFSIQTLIKVSVHSGLLPDWLRLIYLCLPEHDQIKLK